MSPVSCTMLQQNNNNNYQCFNMSGSTGEGFQKCPRTPVPFPSRLELSLGGLPLVRGLRAWALCSKNRLKTGGELGGGQAPTAHSTTHGGTTCPRPADMYPTGQMGSMGYGLDARQAGIGALVTVATLKTSEAGGKTQTQCLFLRTEKGSCLYSTTKPGAWSLGKAPGMATSGASALVRSWLRGKVGGGGAGGVRENQAGKRTGGPTPPAQTGSNRVRMRSGRRWRKSSAAAGPGQNKTGLGSQPRSREEAGAEVVLGERQEERDKGEFLNELPGGKSSPGFQPDRRGGRRQESAGASRSCRSCHNSLADSCARCARRAGRGPRQGLEERNSQGEDERVRNGLNKEDGEMTKDDKGKGERKERDDKKNRSKSLDAIVFVPNLYAETNHVHPDSFSNSRSGGSKRAREINKQLQTNMSEKNGEPCPQNTETRVISKTLSHVTGSWENLNDRSGKTRVINDLRHYRYHDDNIPPAEAPFSTLVNPLQENCEDAKLDINGLEHFSPVHREHQQDSLTLCDLRRDKRNNLGPVQSLEVSSSCEVEQRPLSSPPARVPDFLPETSETSRPLEGSTFTSEPNSDVVQGDQAKSAPDSKQLSRKKTFVQHEIESDDTENKESEESSIKLCTRFKLQESTSVSLHKESQCSEEKPMKVVSGVNPNELGFQDDTARNEGVAREVDVGGAASSPGLREEDGHRGAAVSETDGGILSASPEEEDKRKRDEEDCSGFEFKEATEERRGDELAEEHRREESENCVDGEGAVDLSRDDGGGGISGQESREGGEDGRRETHDDKHSHSEEDKFDEGNAEYGGRKPYRSVPKDSFTGGGQRLEATCSPHLSPLPLEQETTAASEGREKVETCCFFSLISNITTTANVSSTEPPKSKTRVTANPAPPLPPLGAIATADLPCLWAGGTDSRAEGGSGRGGGGVKEGEGMSCVSPEEPGEEEGRCKESSKEQRDVVAIKLGEHGTHRAEKEEDGGTAEEDEFGVFMQADGEPIWSEFAPADPESTGVSTQWTSGWTADSFHQSDDSWAAFSQDSSDGVRNTAGHWWPINAAEERRGHLSPNQNVMEVLSRAFPWSPWPHPPPYCEPPSVPTLTQLLQGERNHSRTSQDQGLLDNFHDLNKMIDQRYKRANGVSRTLLLKSLHLEPAFTESRNVRSTNHRLSPGLPSASRHTQNTKRRLSYDYNRNATE